MFALLYAGNLFSGFGNLVELCDTAAGENGLRDAYFAYKDMLENDVASIAGIFRLHK